MKGAKVVRAMRGRASTKLSTDEVMKLTRDVDPESGTPPSSAAEQAASSPPVSRVRAPKTAPIQPAGRRRS